ncbi:MAG: hypothetical protein IKL24_07145, partial [Clostridia bacterium]|nr:hypothetical protein [Clostridia bacterium]
MLDKRDIKKLILLFAAGVSAGFLNGFLGAGGGIILMWLFNRQCGGEGADNVRDSFASVVAIVLMISTVSAVSYS